MNPKTKIDSIMESLDEVMETERPCCYDEFVGQEECWQELGMRIRWTIPKVPGTISINMYDPLILKLCLECKKPIPMRDVSAWAWTHIFHADNHEGIYREIKLNYMDDLRRWDDNGLTWYEFSAVVFPTHNGTFREPTCWCEKFRNLKNEFGFPETPICLTFNVKFHDKMIWADEFQSDSILEVLEPRPNNIWVAIARQSQITKNIFLGNHLSVLVAEEMGFDKVLNLDEVTQEQILSNTKVDFFSTIRLFMDTEPGGGHVIAEDKIVKIVDWLKEYSATEGRVLVGDRTGQGRAGSALTSYIYANNPNLTFEEAYDFVKSRRFVFCHKGLKNTLTKLYPRD